MTRYVLYLWTAETADDGDHGTLARAALLQVLSQLATTGEVNGVGAGAEPARTEDREGTPGAGDAGCSAQGQDAASAGQTPPGSEDDSDSLRRPRALLCVTYRCVGGGATASPPYPDVIPCAAPDDTLTHDAAIAQARTIYSRCVSARKWGCAMWCGSAAE